MDEPDLAHFHSIPWCSTLLTKTPYVLTPTFSRQPKSSTEDSLFAIALSSPTTIPHCLSLYLSPTPPETFITSLITLFTLGNAMNGGVNMLHGGMVSTLMDDTMGTLLTVNKEEEGEGGRPLSQSTVTARLDVRFLRGVRTPGTVLVEARCVRREGRKFWLEAEVRDGQGEVLAKSEALWIRVARGKL